MPRVTDIQPRRKTRVRGGAIFLPTPPEQLTATPQRPQQPLVRAQLPQFRAAELVVMVRGGQPDTVAAQLAQSFNLNLQETLSLALLPDVRVYRFGIPDNRSVAGLAAVVANMPDVALASPNFYYRLQQDAASQAQRFRGMQYALPRLHVPDAQSLVSGRGAIIAVIDSGVDAGHPALAGANLTLYNAVEGAANTPDKHGTAITGIIAARHEMKGIAPGAKVLAVRAFASEKEGEAPITTSMTLARAVDLAFHHGARIFNMSFAAARDALLITLIDTASAQGAIFVAAAGNNGPDAAPPYPAAYEKVIAITATDENDRLYEQANRGRYVAAAAPGVDILVPVTDRSFAYLSGTSFAAAQVSGIIALLMERNPSLTAETARRALVQGAHDLGADGHDQAYGAGLADAYASLMLAGKQ